jgi:putative two-component system response regulator
MNSSPSDFAAFSTAKAALDQIYKLSPLGIGGHFLVFLIVLNLFIDLVPLPIFLLGIIVHGSIFLFRTFSVWKYTQIGSKIIDYGSFRLWLNIYRIGVALTGIAWGFSVILLSYDVPQAYHFFLFTIIVGLAGAGLVTLGMLLSIYLSYMIPILSIPIVWFFMQNEKMHTTAGLLTLILMGFYYLTAKRFSLNIKNIFVEKDNVLETQFEIIQRLSKAAELRDNETGMHIVRMSYYTYLLALKYGFDEPYAQMLQSASSMHDIGKIGISDSILLKPGKLDSNEFETMKTHTQIGKHILEGSKSELIKLSESIAYSHHEKYDGTGYPQGLKGEEIPIEGRIASVCDVFDALVSNRPYKKRWSNEEAIAFITTHSGKHFDPVLVTYFLELIPKIEAFQATHRDL